MPGVVAVAPVREATLQAQRAAATPMRWWWAPCPEYARTARLELASGRFLADLDVTDRKRVAVLGAAVARALFPFGDPRGERVFVGGDWYQVVGVLDGRARPGGRRAHPHPRREPVRLHPPARPRPGQPTRGPDGIDEIVLRVRRRSRWAPRRRSCGRCWCAPPGREAFEVVVPREILRQKERTQRIFNVVTGAIAAISLLVGGIGIMNIMLASVAERTPRGRGARAPWAPPSATSRRSSSSSRRC